MAMASQQLKRRPSHLKAPKEGEIPASSGIVPLSYSALRKWALLYCFLPVVLFVLFWVVPWIGIPCAAAIALILATAMARKASTTERDRFTPPFRWGAGRDGRAEVVKVSIRTIAVLAIISLIWCILGGQGGFWYQSGDWDARNALLRDLVTHPWPVRYESDGGWLCYYIGHWLPPALIGRLGLLSGVGLVLAWRMARVALLLWTSTGMLLIMLLVVVTVGRGGMRAIVACTVVLILFSTPDALAMVLAGSTGRALTALHLEWWYLEMQYSSITTCLFWVFNQAVVPWICTLCFLNEASPRLYLPIWLACLFGGPLPAIGLAALMLFQAAHVLLRERTPGLVGSIASPANILALPVIAVVSLYIASNQTGAVDLAEEAAGLNLLPAPLFFPSGEGMVRMTLAFVTIEGLLIPLLLMRVGYRGPLLWGSIILLILCPFIRVSRNADFCMRVTIPSIMALCVLCADFVGGLACRLRPPVPRLATAALLVVLLLGSATPLTEFYRGFHSVATVGVKASLNDPIVTFEDKTEWPRTNYVCDGSSVFFRYLVRR